MRIAFYTPFKPLDHRHPSGDWVIARGLVDYLSGQGCEIWPVGPLRARWIYWKPWHWPDLIRVLRQSRRQIHQKPVNLWLTYHTYYKAPDLLGPYISRKANIPYVIFQGIFSTKRRRRVQTWPGFMLNKKALSAAQQIFTNRHDDWINLQRVVPTERLCYVKPGIVRKDFFFDAEARTEVRRLWGVGQEPVVLSAAMFRPDVKSEGLAWVIRACGRLVSKGIPLFLTIAGDGKEKAKLKRLAAEHLPNRVIFAGKIAREKMYRFYSAGDVFAFPGINESLGMVYLESQACGLPVVAFNNAGVPEVVADKRTGLLTPVYDEPSFDDALESLLMHTGLRKELGNSAVAYVRDEHDLIKNYRDLRINLERIVREYEYDQ
jgi:glycosyltransferase involved in cell wall biosynthesis